MFQPLSERSWSEQRRRRRYSDGSLQLCPQVHLTFLFLTPKSSAMIYVCARSGDPETNQPNEHHAAQTSELHLIEELFLRRLHVAQDVALKLLLILSGVAGNQIVFTMNTVP